MTRRCGRIRTNVAMAALTRPVTTTDSPAMTASYPCLATSDAVPMIIDRGRAMGYCFGKVDRSGQVVGDRYVSSDRPIPQALR